GVKRPLSTPKGLHPSAQGRVLAHPGGRCSGAVRRCFVSSPAALSITTQTEYSPWRRPDDTHCSARAGSSLGGSKLQTGPEQTPRPTPEGGYCAARREGEPFVREHGGTEDRLADRGRRGCPQAQREQESHRLQTSLQGRRHSRRVPVAGEGVG